MASRCRSLSQPTLSLLKSTFTKPFAEPKSAPFLRAVTARSSLTISGSVPPACFPYIGEISHKPQSLNFRSIPQLGALQSLLPLHTAVSSARLTSCLGVDSRNSRSLSQGMLCSANPGV
ncbi:hypothetical protein CJ030_MR8G014201 [Morella rubra]|uniref:Protein NUCLEAR FUSION DEFECTIVE 6, chloroplastic/mitochondrial n=1 Tax=Morella rubra TaxID=262757 RepID=A0A6A1UWZ9_9ROSI|nr:hypothetical protein CJ030_MR8G014201 [Morella rubra]